MKSTSSVQVVRQTYSIVYGVGIIAGLTAVTAHNMLVTNCKYDIYNDSRTVRCREEKSYNF